MPPADAVVPVLVVGAGPVGTMGALLLARQGVEARLLDRRETPLRAPAAHVVGARTFEICRAAGVESRALLEFAVDPRDGGQAIWVTSLAGEEIGRLPFERQDEEVLRFTPTPLRNLAQHRFEAVLRETLPKAGAAVAEYGQQWESGESDAAGITSRVRDLESDRVYEIRSRYLLACDGAGSHIRKSVGIEMVGPPRLQAFVMIHFRANLRPLVAERPGVLYWLVDPTLGPTFVAHHIESEWVYMVPFDPDRESRQDYPVERCEALVRAGIGSDAFPVQVETVGTWVMSAQIAERFREGRVFLAGDAAHRFPPTGGLGLNSGIQDVHGLAWRLAAVEAGWAAPSILDAYDAERRPVAEVNTANSLRNASRLLEIVAAFGFDREPTAEQMHATLSDPAGRARVEAAIANQAEHFDTLGLQLGYRYDSDAILVDGTPEPVVSNPARDFIPSGRPGARMPHAWIAGEGGRCSTLDLLAPDAFSLVTTEPDSGWENAVAGIDGVPVRSVVLGRAALEDVQRWLEDSGLGPGGALLVRPDQHVAWRVASRPADPAAALRSALERLVGAQRT